MLKILEKAEMECIYRTQMQEDFPAAEIKPWKRMEQMLEEGIYFAYGWYEKGELVSYAYFVQADQEYVLLDYYAVCAEQRGNGIGSLFLQMIQETLKEQGIGSLILEVENPAWAETKEEKQVQESRIHFYERNGLRLTANRSRLFGVEYQIMTLPVKRACDDWQCHQGLERVYQAMFPLKYLGREVVLY